MYRFFQIFKRDFLNLVFNPMWLFYSTVFPFLLVLILGFLTSGNYGSVSSVTSYDYYGITMMLYIIFSTSTVAANSFMEERLKSGNMRIIYSPVRANCIHFSKVLATFVYSILCHTTVFIALYFVLGVNFGGNNAGYILTLFMFFEFFSSTLGILFCCIFKSESISNQILSMIISIFAILGGLFFQLDGLGKAIEKISYISPVKWMVKAIFGIIYDNNFTFFIPTLIILSVLSAGTMFLSNKFFRTEDYI